jgi:hypothetical protein
MLFGGFDLATLTRLPVLVVELSSTIIGWLAMPVLVSVIAPATGRAGRVPLFITVYDYYYAVTVVVSLGAGLLIAASGVDAVLSFVMWIGLSVWLAVVGAFAFRAVLQTGWQPAIALAVADFLLTQAVSDWADTLIGTVVQS